MWLRRVLLLARLPGVAIPEVQNLVEMHTMLAERIVEWTQQWKEEGLQEGQVQEVRVMVLEAVAAHFGEMPPDMVATVQRVEDRERYSHVSPYRNAGALQSRSGWHAHVW